jgi:hypothetical protein
MATRRGGSPPRQSRAGIWHGAWLVLVLVLPLLRKLATCSSSSCSSSIGADSRFFALLGSAPQELNTVRPEAKLTR